MNFDKNKKFHRVPNASSVDMDSRRIRGCSIGERDRIAKPRFNNSRTAAARLGIRLLKRLTASDR
jgi:hypothetical protein